MLWAIGVILFAMWTLEMVSSQLTGGFVHVLLVGAFVVIVIDLFRGRRPRPSGGVQT